jgi:hypothetical protein
VPEIWAGVDIGKEHHHCVVINADGERLLSRRVLNDETELLQLIGDVLSWGVTSLDRPGATNSSAALWSNEKPHDAAADQVGGAALFRRAGGLHDCNMHAVG